MSKKIILLGIVCTLAIASYAGFVLTRPADAASKYEILSNSTYLNKNSMSKAQIQKFLAGKKSTLATYKDKGLNDSKKELASTLIYNAAQAWGINPQVLLATLQKEQSLITNQNPQSWAYRSAMGYGCPDSAACNAAYYGFGNQVNIAAYQFRYNYEALRGKSSFVDGDGDRHGVGAFACNQTTHFYSKPLLPGNRVTFKRNTAFASAKDKTVIIANEATASFLCYTPHVGPYSATGYSGSDNFIFYFSQWFGSPTNSYDFKFEKLAGPKPAKLRVNSASLGTHTKTLADGDNIYTFYHDETNKTIRYSFWNGSRWSDHLLDGKGAKTPGAVSHDVGKGIDAIAWKNDIQLYYYDATSGDLRHAWLKNSKWRTETMDGSKKSLSGQASSTGQNPKVLLRKGNLQLYYYDKTNGSLKHAWWPGDGRWHFETMDGTKNSLGKSTADVGSEIDAFIYGKDNLQLYYYDKTNGSLKHAWWPGDGRWHFETMDGTKNSLGKSTADVGSAVSTTLYNGKIQMFYHSKTTGELKHAWWHSDKTWHFETMDGDVTKSVLGNFINAGSKISVGQFKKDLAVMYYDDATNFNSHESSWRLAYWNGSSWQQSILDGGDTTSQSGSSATVSGDLSMDVYKGRSLQVYYRGATGALTHAWYNK